MCAFTRRKGSLELEFIAAGFLSSSDWPMRAMNALLKLKIKKMGQLKQDDNA